MAGIAYTKLIEALRGIGVDVSQQSGSNVKKLTPKNKSTATKPGILTAERDTGGNFMTVLDIFKNEAKYINSMDDVQQMNFLNNIMDYNEFGGPKILSTSELNQQARDLGLEFKGLRSDKEDITSGIENILKTSKTMKDDAEAGLASAKKDLDDFITTGGQPLKAKSDKYLGGSMHEEGQLRTAIRTFLKNEYKNGKIKLDKDDQFRIMEYSPMMEDDPIKVFKKIYGEEAYNKAGTFPGAFSKGENFNHYEQIFKENMGEDLLKVKDKKYVGDGTLMLTDEVRTPTPDDDVPFAEGGIADFRIPFASGKVVTSIIEYLTTKFSPMEAMKEINKVIGKTGKYKNLKLTQKDIDKIVEDTNDFIFQRDPDNLFVEGSIKEKTKYFDEDDVLERDLFAPKSDTQVFKDSEGGIKGITMGGDDKFKKAMSEAMEEGMRESENMKRLGLDPSKMKDALKYDKMKEAGQMEKNVTGSADLSPAEDLMKKYPGMNKELAEQIANDPDPTRKANVIAMVEQTFKLSEKGKSGDEIIEIFKKGTDRTKQADGGITRLRNGYYGGGQAMVEPDLSDIGHGSDALMARTRVAAPGSQATTSTGLNYLLGEDNDNIRVPFNQGLLVPPAKPYTPDMFEKDSMTLLQGMYGTGKDSNEFLYNEMIKKGNILRNQGVERETVIEIIRNNKDKINAFLETQTGDKKTFKGMSDGGITELRQGYAGGKGVDISKRGFLKFLGGTAAGVAALKTGLVKMFGKESGAISKKAIDEVIIEGGSGAPAWLQPLVNKALREGTDISKQAVKDGQVVKSLDTPTGKVDVYYDTRTGEIDIDYIGGNTALGESVNMRYVPGVADEGTKGVKPMDEFEASEAIPEGQMSSPNDYNVELGENVTGDVKELYSDTSELAELGGQNPLIKDISETIKKKKVLKQMNENPDKFASDNLRDDFPDYDYGDVNPDYD